MTPRALSVLGVATAVCVVACTDFIRTNPYDQHLPMDITVTGPDTLFSRGEAGHFAVTSVPSMPDTAFEWIGASSDGLTTGTAVLRDTSPPLYPATRVQYVYANVGHLDTVKTVDAIVDGIVTGPGVIWRHSGRKAVVLTQRITHVALRCPDIHACDSLSVGGIWSVWADPLDSLNSVQYNLLSASNPSTGIAVATFAVRDPTVASLAVAGIRVANLTALKSGTTWIVATHGTAADSLRLVVR